MAGHLFAGVLGNAKNEKAKIHEHRMDGLAGQFHAAAPTAGTGEGAGDLAVNLHPRIDHFLIPKTFHLPREHAHIGGAAHGEAVTPFDVRSSGVVHAAHAHLGVGHQRCALADKVSHLLHIASSRIEENEDLVHFNFAGSSTACFTVLRCQV